MYAIPAATPARVLRPPAPPGLPCAVHPRPVVQLLQLRLNFVHPAGGDAAANQLVSGRRRTTLRLHTSQICLPFLSTCWQPAGAKFSTAGLPLLELLHLAPQLCSLFAAKCAADWWAGRCDGAILDCRRFLVAAGWAADVGQDAEGVHSLVSCLASPSAALRLEKTPSGLTSWEVEKAGRQHSAAQAWRVADASQASVKNEREVRLGPRQLFSMLAGSGRGVQSARSAPHVSPLISVSSFKCKSTHESLQY